MSGRFHDQSECSLPRGKTSECGQIATELIARHREVSRLARLANKSPERFAQYADELRQAKEYLGQIRERRDNHMAECSGAADRFGAA